MTRLAIVAASAAARARLARAVGEAGSVSITTAAASIDDLASDARLASSDVVLLHGAADLGPRDLAALPPIPVIVIADGRSPERSMAAILASGARGVLPDDASGDEIVAAVEAVAAGLVVVPPELVGELLAARPATAEAGALASGAGASIARQPGLTPREREILAMLAEGLPNKHIASRLGISEHTVKTHLEALFDKLGASTRAEAVARGVRSGLLLL